MGIADRLARRRSGRQRSEEAVQQERRIYGQLAQFVLKAPPLDWEAQHRRAFSLTTSLAHTTDVVTVLANRPVPRQASCDFYGRDQDPRNFYFY